MLIGAGNPPSGCGGELQEAVAFRAGLAGHAIGSHELLGLGPCPKWLSRSLVEVGS